MSTLRSVDKLDGADRAVRIVYDCFVDSDGERIYQTIEDVEKAFDDEALSLEDLRHIATRATDMTTTEGEGKKD
jgi:hypothetical protein